MKNTDTERLEALAKMGNIAIWHGSWAEHMGDKAGKPIVRITAMDDDGYELVGDDLAEGDSLASAIDDHIANDQGDGRREPAPPRQ